MSAAEFAVIVKKWFAHQATIRIRQIVSIMADTLGQVIRPEGTAP